MTNSYSVATEKGAFNYIKHYGHEDRDIARRTERRLKHSLDEKAVESATKHMKPENPHRSKPVGQRGMQHYPHH
jgi:hypothetical protein